MCKHGEFETIVINGREIPIDKCLVQYVKALNDAGIQTSMSCCGHGEGDGFILVYHEEQYRLLIFCPEGEESLNRFADDFRDRAADFENRMREKNGI